MKLNVLIAIFFLSATFLSCGGKTDRCVSDGECLGDELCISERCQIGCKNDGHCSATQNCFLNQCRDKVAPFFCSSDKDCQSPKICNNNICTDGVPCQNACNAGQFRCDPSNVSAIQECRIAPSGCLDWLAHKTCQTNEFCENSNCRAKAKTEGDICHPQNDPCGAGFHCVGSDSAGFRCLSICSRTADCKKDWGCYNLVNGSKACVPTQGAPEPPFDAKCGLGAIRGQVNGGNWDPFGGAPDPFVSVEIDGTEVLRTKTINDSFTPVWEEGTKREFSFAQIYRAIVRMYDEDVTGQDLMLTWSPSQDSNFKMTTPQRSDITVSTSDGNVTLLVRIICEW